MKRREFVAGLIGAAIGSATIASIPSLSEMPAESAEKRRDESADRRRNRFPNVLLMTHEGKEVRFYDDLVKGKIVLINMMYTRCQDGLCLPTTANLARLQDNLGDRLGHDIFIYSITLDPEYDIPSVLKKYAENFDVRPGWYFLTGNKPDIERLRKKLGYVWADPIKDNDRTQHTGMLRFGIEPLDLWGACPALTKPKWIARYVSWLEPAGGRSFWQQKKKMAIDGG